MKIALAISLIVVVVGVVLFVFRYASIEGCKVCWGRVSDLPASSDSDGTTYQIVADFRDESGTAYQYRSSWSSSSPGYHVGDGIRLYFNPDDPNKNGIMTFMGAYGFYSIMIGMGLLCSLIFACSIYSLHLMEVIHKSKFTDHATDSSVERF